MTGETRAPKEIVRANVQCEELEKVVLKSDEDKYF